jgi:hypothetical protein
MTDLTTILQHLLYTPPVRLDTVPRGQGIYALYDHEGRARYIGFTAKCLNDRIFKRHVGGDGNSHKFSSIYNAGRMFHDPKQPATCSTDGLVAKELRRLFVREHCRAVAIPLPGLSRDQLVVIEAAMLSLAPTEAKSWNYARALEAYEPTEVLDAFLAALVWPRNKLDAIERQARRWLTIC